MTLSIKSLYEYPLKSGRGNALTQAEVNPFGLAADRHWMLVDHNHQFLSQRQWSSLGFMVAQSVQQHIHLEFNGQHLHAEASPQYTTTVQVWKDTLEAWGTDTHINNTLSEWLGQPVQLVYCPHTPQREVDTHYAPQGHYTAFSDGFPFLIISQASINALEQAWGKHINPLRFRPNIIIDGACAPFAEDTWQYVQVGEVVFKLVKPCSRCVIPSFNPDTLEPDAHFLRFLATARKMADGKVYVGQNAVVTAGHKQHIKVGDTVTIVFK